MGHANACEGALLRRPGPTRRSRRRREADARDACSPTSDVPLALGLG